MINQNSKISAVQLSFIIIQTQIGVGVLSLPHDVAAVSKNDGWISTFIAGIIVQILLFLLWLLFKKFPTLTLYEIMLLYFGKVIGSFIIISYTVYFTIVGSFVLTKFSQIIQLWILQKTPRGIIIFLMLGVCVYLIKDSLRSIARFYVLVTPLILILIALIIYSLKDANILYILPIGVNGVSNILRGAKEATFSMIGFEILFILYPFVEASKKGILKSITIAHLTVTILYTFLVFSSLIYFESNRDIALTPQPLLYMIKAYAFQIFERTDLFFLSIWMISVATSISSWLLLSSKALTYLFKGKRHSSFLPYIAGLMLVISLIPKTATSIVQFNQLLNPAHYCFLVAIPMLLLLISIIWPKHGLGENKE